MYCPSCREDFKSADGDEAQPPYAATHVTAFYHLHPITRRELEHA